MGDIKTGDKYIVVTRDHVITVQDRINELIKGGWQPIGGASYADYSGFIQALYREHTPEELTHMSNVIHIREAAEREAAQNCWDNIFGCNV